MVAVIIHAFCDGVTNINDTDKRQLVSIVRSSRTRFLRRPRRPGVEYKLKGEKSGGGVKTITTTVYVFLAGRRGNFIF
jgi:hypothetical protein